jgi:ABC-type antimicrobial peptide transport system permease subunit
MMVKVRTSKLKPAVGFIINTYSKILPQERLGLSNLGENISNNVLIKILNKIVFFLTVIPILAGIIAIMGIFALALQSVERRTKEIGIRKIFGTPIHKLILLMTREYTVLILIAIVIALSMAYYFLNVVIDRGRYEVPGIFTYLIIGLSAYVIGMLTVIFMVVKAVRRNPVDALRYE